MARYRPAKKPWSHQTRAMSFLRGRAVAALLMAMRTGKTKVVLDWFGELELEGNCQDLLVVAPGGVYRTWEGAAQEHLSSDLRGRLLVHTWESSGGVQHGRHLDWFLRQLGRPRMLLVNTEATSRVKLAREAVLTFLGQRDNMCAYDESTSIKNPDSKMARFAVDEVKPLTNYRLVLSGLPSPKSPLDVYMQFEFLDSNILGAGSWEGFRSRFSVVRRLPLGPVTRLPDGTAATHEDGSVVRRVIPVLVGYRDVPSIRRKIEAHSFRATLESCYDLPPKMYSYRDVEFHPEQRRVYEELRDYATAQLSQQEELGHVTVNSVVVQVLRLHQVLCGHAVTELGERREVPELRTESLLELLEDYDGKAVIWCSYDYSVQKVAGAISERFKEFGQPARVARFWGGNRATREEEERVFKEDPSCRWMVGTPHAGRFGRDWRVADLVVFYSNSPDLEHRLQGEDRVQGVGVKVSKGYVDMRVPGTVDQRWIESLKRKRSLSDAITGDEWREWLR